MTGLPLWDLTNRKQYLIRRLPELNSTSWIKLDNEIGKYEEEVNKKGNNDSEAPKHEQNWLFEVYNATTTLSLEY